MKKFAIFTAIYGDQDVPKSIHPLLDVDWHLWTDNPHLVAPGWTVHFMQGRFQHPRMSAKWVRMNPEVLLPGYEKTAWIDASITILLHEFMELFSLGSFALFKHPDRNNIYDECAVSALMPKYAGQPMREQCNHYKSLGLPWDHGLWATGVLIRDNTSTALRLMNLEWMNENILWSFQDQLSFPYVLWKLGIKPTPIPYNLWACHLIKREWVGEYL